MPTMIRHRRYRHERISGEERLRRMTLPYLRGISNAGEMSLLGEDAAYQQLGISDDRLINARHVDKIYVNVQTLIVRFQGYRTGLFPRRSKDKEGRVRDSIYCAIACWATSIAYRRMDDNRGREYEMRCTAIKTMRGILQCWLRQADNLERYKQSHSGNDALHTCFNWDTGLELIGTNEYHHHQLDVIALYLLTLVQMTTGDLQIIYDRAECAFIQNLVFYLERAYRTPDYGMWERGSRYNTGTPELHASTLGFVKAALEAINGFNVFGTKGTSTSVIYVDIDAHNRNRTTFETLLPRESDSKNTDAALLMVTGWPAYGTHDRDLVVKTNDKIDRKLAGGRYGLKRFLRDGYLSEMENKKERYYKEHETHKFEKFECQWPIFYLYQAITAAIGGMTEQAINSFRQAENLQTQTNDNQLVVPECYFVPEEFYFDERDNENSQTRLPYSCFDNGHFLWAQALYIIAELFVRRLVYPSELDPIYRHLPASQRPRFQHQQSAFLGSLEGDPVAQIALISESKRLQLMLSTYGIQTQTPMEVEPVKIWPSRRLVEVFSYLGTHDRLGLTGRPPRPFGVLSTSKIYRIRGETVLCYPILFELSDFYVSADPSVLIDDIKKDLAFTTRRWKLTGRPTYCIVLREENIKGAHFDEMLELLVSLKNGEVNGVRVRVGRVQNLLGAGCTEHLDFLNKQDDDEIKFSCQPFTELSASNMAQFVSLRDISRQICYVELDRHAKEDDFYGKNDDELRNLVSASHDSQIRSKAFALGVLQKRHGYDYQIDSLRVCEHLNLLYRECIVRKLWWIVRYCAVCMRKCIDSMAPSVTTILVRGKRLTFGRASPEHAEDEIHVNKPMAPNSIIKTMFDNQRNFHPLAPVMQQEVLVAAANLISSQPNLFAGVLTIRVAWLIEGMQMLIDNTKKSLLIKHDDQELLSNDIYDYSPMRIKQYLELLLSVREVPNITPLQRRRMDGAISRVPVMLHDLMWEVMKRCSGGIVIAGVTLPQQPTLTDMTEYELTFVLAIERLLDRIVAPEYRQIMLELLLTLSTVLNRNPEVSFNGALDMDALIQRALDLFKSEYNSELGHQSIGEESNDPNNHKHSAAQKTLHGPFYELPFDGAAHSTSIYFCRAIVETLLCNNDQLITGPAESCRIS